MGLGAVFLLGLAGGSGGGHLLAFWLVRVGMAVSVGVVWAPMEWLFLPGLAGGSGVAGSWFCGLGWLPGCFFSLSAESGGGG